MSNDVFSFLKPSDGHGAELSTPEFSNNGYIGQLIAMKVHRFWLDFEPESRPDESVYLGGGNNGAGYYAHRVLEVANEFAQANGAKYTQTIWHLDMDVNSLLNVNDTSKFQYGLSSFVRIYEPSYLKGMHPFHLMSLPYAVQAGALLAGYIKERLFDIPELMAQDFIATDELQKQLIGDTSTHYTECDLFKRKQELYKALGQEDAISYTTIGNAKYAVKSEKLSQCLRLVEDEWSMPMWAQMMLLPDPRVDAISPSSGNRYKVPVIYTLYGSKEEAMQAAGKTEESKPDSVVEVATNESAQSTNGKPALPKEWRQLPENLWTEHLAALKASTELPKLPPQQMAVFQKIATDSSATVEDVKAWWDLV